MAKFLVTYVHSGTREEIYSDTRDIVRDIAEWIDSQRAQLEYYHSRPMHVTNWTNREAPHYVWIGVADSDDNAWSYARIEPYMQGNM